MWKAGEGWLVFVTSLVFVAGMGFALGADSEAEKRYSITMVDGSLFVSDAGSSHGGFEMTAEYSVVLSSVNGGTVYSDTKVVLGVRYETGLGNPIGDFDITMRISYNPNEDTVLLGEGRSAFALVHVEKDVVWDGRYDGYYIASRGGDALPEETMGYITPWFFGLPTHYYIEMRLDLRITPVL